MTAHSNHCTISWSKKGTVHVSAIDKLRDMVKRQGSMFPKSSDYDYRKVFDDINVSKLETYFDAELLQMLNKGTGKERG